MRVNENIDGQEMLQSGTIGWRLPGYHPSSWPKVSGMLRPCPNPNPVNNPSHTLGRKKEAGLVPDEENIPSS